MNLHLIATAEQKLAAAFQYEKRVPGDRDKIILACRLVDAHARKVRRLIEQGAAVSPRTQSILAYLERAS
jgi:hypothetical protein